MKFFNIILFDQFETLDAFGPAEIIGKLTDDYRLEYYSLNGGIVTSAQNIRVDTLPLSRMGKDYILLVPGGMGTRSLVDDEKFISELKAVCTKAEYLLAVCTGSALLAKAGLLKKISATSNKRAFDWVCSIDQEVNWVRKARWVVEDRIYTSSGVSAGMDMTLGFIADTNDFDKAQNTAKAIEYIWNQDKTNDIFAG